MVLPHPERVETESVSENRLFNHLAEHSRLGIGRAVRLQGHIAERVEPELEPVCHRPSLSDATHDFRLKAEATTTVRRPPARRRATAACATSRSETPTRR